MKPIIFTIFASNLTIENRKKFNKNATFVHLSGLYTKYVRSERKFGFKKT
jgi:hypothetical protein